MEWFVYILLCSDGSLYTGITTDVSRRISQHAAKRGAKYFRGRSPLQIVYLEAGHDRCSSSRRENQLKKLKSDAKRQLIASERSKTQAMLAAFSGDEFQSPAK